MSAAVPSASRRHWRVVDVIVPLAAVAASSPPFRRSSPPSSGKFRSTRVC
ncbi:apolipoprotein N-acyltransferase [Sesbania bispinosa]|nr:apolipoprotein N-acyltransferase [Sesbania bispinosa]